jgi:hypothetical protein
VGQGDSSAAEGPPPQQQQQLADVTCTTSPSKQAPLTAPGCCVQGLYWTAAAAIC